MEPHLNFRVKRCAAHDKHLNLAAESIEKFLADFLVNDGIDARNLQGKLHDRLADNRKNGSLEYFLHDERNRDDKIRMNLLHRAEQQGRCRCLTEVVDG